MTRPADANFTAAQKAARLATIRRDLAHMLPEERGGYVWFLMLDQEWQDDAVRAVIWERPDAAALIAEAKRMIGNKEDTA